LEPGAFIDGVPALAWSALPDGPLDFVNRSFRDYTGLSADQLYGSAWKSVVHRDDVRQLETWWRSLAESQEAGTAESAPSPLRRRVSLVPDRCRAGPR